MRIVNKLVGILQNCDVLFNKMTVLILYDTFSIYFKKTAPKLVLKNKKSNFSKGQ